ncbi:class I SAM-dependent methyltransferase [Leptospira levettii]|nr:class I SAM-dependent methyltransferase [Leptospira levettii]TGM25680.1 class I SAM-dependent methyltransferase [Leptospira levettii]TGM75309.1 class I SAM-dependent methyltransferase [Leptospira levettii]TGM85911.1 class I SAM-dependent methyltransferase [Leptospira levettii]
MKEPKEHYENHLGIFYSWMLGDLEPKIQAFQEYLIQKKLTPLNKEVSIDLGAGNGLQSIALARLGYEVIAIDFNLQLLKELEETRKKENLPIQTINADILTVSQWKNQNPSFLLCCGDTLTHLSSINQIQEFLKLCYETLTPNGNLLLSFRDYSNPLRGDSRFIPVKADDNRILTCILEDEGKKLRVTDQLYEKSNGSWQMKISSYYKTKLSKEECLSLLKGIGFQFVWDDVFQRMTTILVTK